MKRPMLLAAVSCLLLSAFSFYFRKGLLLFAVSLVIITAFVVYNTKNIKFLFVSLFVLIVSVGLLSAYKLTDRIKLLNNSYVHEEFVALSDTEFSDNYTTIKVECISGKVLPKGVRLLLYTENGKVVFAGQKFSASAKIKCFKTEYDKRTWYSEGIYASGSISKWQFSAKRDAVYTFIGNVRRYIKHAVFEFLGGDTAAVIVAMTVGDRSYLSDELYMNTKITGISHIMVVSGLHLYILLGGFFTILNKFVRNKYIKFVFSFVGVLFITAVCGFTMSILRAGVMFVFASIAPLLNRENDSLNSLGAAITAVLIITPFAALNVAFQLSFVATYAIVDLAPFYSKISLKYLRINSDILSKINFIVVSSMVVSLSVLPILITVFGYASLIAPLTNLLITYAVSITLGLSAIGIIIPKIPLFLMLRKTVFFFAGIFSNYIFFVINTLARIPFASVDVARWVLPLSVLTFAGLIFLKYFCEYVERKKLLGEELLWRKSAKRVSAAK